MNFFIDSVAAVLYNKIVDITEDSLDPDMYESIDTAIDIAIKVICRYKDFEKEKFVDEIKNLKKEVEK